MTCAPARRSRSMPRTSATRCCCASTSMTRRGDRRADRQGGLGHGPSVAPTILVVPGHGRRSASSSSRLFALGFYLAARRRIAQSPPVPEESRSGRCRCRGLRPRWAGSSPNTDGNPGSIEGVLPTFLAVSPIPAVECRAQPRRLRRLLHGRSLSSTSFLPQEIRKARTRRGLRPRATAAARGGFMPPALDDHVRFRNLESDLVAAARRSVDRLCDHGRLRSGRRDVAALRRARRYRAARRHQHDRPRLGRQPGLVDPGRWRDLCGMAGAICGELLGILSGDAARARRIDPAAGGFQVPQQDARRPWRASWDWAVVRRRPRADAGVRRCDGQPARRRARSASTRELRATTRSASSTCSIPSRCCAVGRQRGHAATHGARYLALKTDGVVASGREIEPLDCAWPGYCCLRWPESGLARAFRLAYHVGRSGGRQSRIRSPRR